jgi:hypothetical protein
MFRAATMQNTRRAQPQLGTITPLAIPAKGLNARDAFALMPPEYAISLVNALCEPYGLRTRKGYTEWATGMAPVTAVKTMMSYYPATAAPAALASFAPASLLQRMMVEGAAPRMPPAGKLFAATYGQIFDVTAGGTGPWTPEAGVGTPAGTDDVWTWLNFQNLAGSFLPACRETGGYAYYDGAAWHTPVAGAGVGQINGCDPAKFCYVTEFKKRLWFIEKDSTSAWYLPVSQITGNVTEFNFGEQFRHGGYLVAITSWTVDSGISLDDYLVAVGSQGDVVLYKGVDPDTVGDFQIFGVWHLGPLPIGRRSVLNTGADVHILSQFGVNALSKLLATVDLAQTETSRMSYMISPVIARLMRESNALDGWKIVSVPKEELFLIGVPPDSLELGGDFFGLKLSTGGWSQLKNLPYASFVSIDADCFAGTFDGRVVRAFDGPLDNVLLSDPTSGTPIQCQVTPAYNGMEGGFSTGALQKVFKMLRPTFIATATPSVVIHILTDYGVSKIAVIPTLPDITESKWDEALWDVGKWSGLQDTIKEWIGVHGVGFAGTAQIDYLCGGDTLLASIDFWTETGGVL